MAGHNDIVLKPKKLFKPGFASPIISFFNGFDFGYFLSPP